MKKESHARKLRKTSTMKSIKKESADHKSSLCPPPRISAPTARSKRNTAPLISLLLIVNYLVLSDSFTIAWPHLSNFFHSRNNPQSKSCNRNKLCLSRRDKGSSTSTTCTSDSMTKKGSLPSQNPVSVARGRSVEISLQSTPSNSMCSPHRPEEEEAPSDSSSPPSTTTASSSSSVTTVSGPQHFPFGWMSLRMPSRLFSSTQKEQEKLVGTTAHSQSSSPSESVHLQLNPNANNNSQSHGNKNKHKANSAPMMTELQYHDVRTNTTYMALNTCKRKFKAFLDYQPALKRKAVQEADIHQVQYPLTSSEQQARRDEWRRLWKQRTLLTDRTEFLAIYPSDQKQQEQHNLDQSQNSHGRRGGFRDLLSLYTDRFYGILQDEQLELEELHRGKDRTRNSVLGWLQQHYGQELTQQLMAPQLQKVSHDEQLDRIRAFCQWFKRELPYYYDACSRCGASFKEDSAKEKEDREPQDTKEDDQQTQNLRANGQSAEVADDSGTFLGYVYPSDQELSGKASRTELYQCHKCKCYTTFPRYNAAAAILESRRGRCGEYSTLLYRFLRSLGLETRWVVDWADHVWAEVLLESNVDSRRPRWVHIDPCEAAVDENFLYQDWGKKQTYIVAFYAPPKDAGLNHDHSAKAPLIQDVTHEYTSESSDAILKRREESAREVEDAIEQATMELDKKLWNPVQKLSP